MAEQRNPYRGPRPWLRLGFRAPDRTVLTLDVIADTGSPAGIILRTDLMNALRVGPLHDCRSNFGLPLLRIGEYGGNATDFWFRYPPTPTTSQP